MCHPGCLASNLKCNGWTEGLDFVGHGFGGGSPAEGLSRAAVHQGGEVVEPSLACVAEVGALGHELAQLRRQAIDPQDQSQRRRPLVFSFEPRGLGGADRRTRCRS